jgi:hypothetical protein
MKQDVKMFIGLDTIQSVAYDACRLSIEDHSDIPISGINMHTLANQGLYWRPIPTGSTEFSFTRFLAPYLKGFYGYAIFCDSDFIWNCDPRELLDHVDPNKAVSVVKHNIQPNQIKPFKMDGKKQSWYPKKNWSSLMVFNCSHPFVKQLMPYTISESPAGYLHEFDWCTDDEYIGSLPHTYNYLVGYYNDIKEPKAIHYTDGGPWHPGYENVEFADSWNYYKEKIIEKYGRL